MIRARLYFLPLPPHMRDDKGHWLKGTSGNPGGSVKTVERYVAETIRAEANLDKRMKRLGEICDSADDAIALAGIKLWLAYAIGLPKATLAVEDKRDSAADILRLRARLEAALVAQSDAGAAADGDRQGEPH